MAAVEPLSAARRQAAIASGICLFAACARPSSYIARREDADAILQYLSAMAISDGAMAGTPGMSYGLSGSSDAAAMRSHNTRSADCACAASGASVKPTAHASGIVTFMLEI